MELTLQQLTATFSGYGLFKSGFKFQKGTFQNGRLIVGEYMDDKLYTGKFLNDKLHGDGAVYLDEGKTQLIHKGHFINGRLNGECCIYENGQLIQKGIFTDDHLTYGDWLCDDGRLCRGTYINGQLNGYGEILENNKLIIKGKFVNDKLINGMKLINDIIYIGNFDGDMIIEGEMKKDNIVYKGKFYLGKLHGIIEILSTIDNTAVYSKRVYWLGEDMGLAV